MTALTTALLAVAALVALADWFAVATRRRAVEYVCKPAALLALVAVAACLHPVLPGRRAWFVVALALSLAGDVLLMLPQDLFVAGLGAFLAAHLAYIAGFSVHVGSGATAAVGAIVVVVVGAAPASRILAAVRRSHHELSAPVTAYLVVISTMVVLAVASRSWLAIAGAGAFYVSDASIAWDRFVHTWSWARTWVMVTYHLGQAGLVLSLAR